jgi:hypothetical protein
VSDYVRLARKGRDRYFHAWKVNGVFANPDGAAGSVVLTSGSSYEVDESPEEIVAMLDEVVNGVPRPVAVPNFPGMEK